MSVYNKALIKLNIYFLIKNDELLEKYNEILEKVKTSMKKQIDSEPAYHELIYV